MLSDYENFLNENMNIPAEQDKNPMFYVFTAARLYGKKKDEELGNDDVLRNALKCVEKLCTEIGTTAVNGIVKDYKPVSILMELSGCSTKKQTIDTIGRIYDWFKQRAVTGQEKFSEYYRIETAFSNFLESEEVKDFFGSL